jgi:serine/threonine-protein kinase
MDSQNSGSSHFGVSIGDAGASSIIGQQIARKYELIRLVGQGGMGAVYEGRNIVTLKRCAVKLLLSPDLATMPHVVKRFFREAQASSVVESEHIVQIFDSGADQETGFPYMVMELLQGEDVGACRSGSCCNRKPICRLLRTAS